MSYLTFLWSSFLGIFVYHIITFYTLKLHLLYVIYISVKLEKNKHRKRGEEGLSFCKGAD